MRRGFDIPSIPAMTLFCFLAMLAAGDFARAAAPVLSCDDDLECAQLAAQAYDAATAGRLTEAQSLYERAYNRRADPKLLFNLGRVLHRGGRRAEAVVQYQKYLDAGLTGEETQRRKAKRLLEQARQETGSATPFVSANSAREPSAVKESPREPLYRKWWLWTAVGVATVGLAVGLGVGLAARRPDLSSATEVRF